MGRPGSLVPSAGSPCGRRCGSAVRDAGLPRRDAPRPLGQPPGVTLARLVGRVAAVVHVVVNLLRAVAVGHECDALITGFGPRDHLLTHGFVCLYLPWFPVYRRSTFGHPNIPGSWAHP